MYYLPSDFAIRDSAASLHLLAFGDYGNMVIRHQSTKIERKLNRIFGDLPDFDWYRYYGDLVCTFQPSPAVGDPTKMAIYESRGKYAAERRTIGKPARMIKKICPALTEAMCNDFAVWWQETFAIDTAQFVITESLDQSDFVAAYVSDQSKTFDPSFVGILGHSFKSLQGSCMRHDFDDLPIHPAAAYASGDFKIVMAKDSAGAIAARCVVSVAQSGIARPKPFAGAVYTTSDAVSQLMALHLESTGCIPDSDWIGSRMVKIEHDLGVILPYVDGHRDLTDHGDFLVFEHRGNITANQTCGYVKTAGETCCECGDSYDPETEGYYVDGFGCVCGHCLNSEFTFCGEESEYIRNSDCETVYNYTSRGRINQETVSRHYAENSGNYVVTVSGDFWAMDDVVYVESWDAYFPNQSDEVFQSAVDDQHYHISEYVDHDGQGMTTDQRDAMLAEGTTDDTTEDATDDTTATTDDTTEDATDDTTATTDDTTEDATDDTTDSITDFDLALANLESILFYDTTLELT